MIAAVMMYNYYRWFLNGKAVFCAPTRPLVSQQSLAWYVTKSRWTFTVVDETDMLPIHSFITSYRIMGIPEKHTAEISRKSKPESRDAMWRNKRVFFWHSPDVSERHRRRTLRGQTHRMHCLWMKRIVQPEITRILSLSD